MDDAEPLEQHRHAGYTQDTAPPAATTFPTMQEKDEHGAIPENETPSCRICRGEEAADEPLFHPCKCNGSIRFVHQACLMEWLSRSQKRHCELCKTPFRFTKLYDPRMPASVPFPVFVKQAFIQVGRAILRLLRYVLVTLVWLCWVPWTMRTMWRFLFWLGDGAWTVHPDNGLVGGATRTMVSNGASTSTALQASLATVLSNETYTASTANGSLPSTLESWFAAAHDFVLPWSFQEGVGGMVQSNRSVPLVIQLGRRLLRDSLALAGVTVRPNITSNTTAAFAALTGHGTMLSDVKYLQTLSKWPALNRTVIDILEGQLITLFVMVLIILVFLIREWVVQQQPNLGMARAPAPELAIEGPPARAAEVIDPAPADAAEPGQMVGRPQTEAEFVDEDGEGDEVQLDDNEIARLEGSTATASPSYHPNLDVQLGVEPLEAAGDSTENFETNHDDAVIPENRADRESSPDHSQRPPMSRHALGKASELHRVLEEERAKVSGDKWPGVQTFMDYWNRGDCQPQKVLDLIRQEGREDELVWIVNAMTRLEEMDPPFSDPSDGVLAALSVELAQNNSSHVQENGSGSDESWQVLDDGSAGSAARPAPAVETEELPSSIPTWLESQNLAWPPEASGSRQGGTRIQKENAIEGTGTGTIPNTNNSIEDEARPTPVAPVIEARDGPTEGAAEEPTARNEQDEAQDSEPAHHAPAAEQVADAGHRATFWDAIANLLWGHVELPAAEWQQVADQLEPILQPEADHEPPPPPPPVVPQGQVPGARPAPAPAPAPVAPGPDPNLAAGLLPPRDPEVLRAAREAGMDPEDIAAIEEGEDLDGLVELIGLQGPLIALVQHGMVCGAIVTLVVFFGIWVPYIVGKVVLVLMSNPVTLLVKLPLRWTSSLINILIDLGIFLGGNVFFWLDAAIRVVVAPIGWVLPIFARMQQNTIIPDTAIAIATRSVGRLAKKFTVEEGFSDSDIPYFSVIAHESLVHIENKIYTATASSYAWLESALETHWSISGSLQGIANVVLNLPLLALKSTMWEFKMIRDALSACISLVRTNPFKLRLEIASRTEPYDLELIHWSTRDRIFAILIGYLAFYAIGAMYVKMRRAMRSDTAVRDEALEILTQAGGVLKVILIISIEMIAFPLYCGLLLDIAMLPLFQDRSLLARLAFTARNPLTSMFLHWFVGTCYMFHFALFVSMCRKAMRTGVLYFIRDPDDPTFHPVRDVLERNLVGQLRKILFSALVYGALVIVCLGAVVWGVAALPLEVLPIKWSSFSPSIELPIDLVVLNFLIPLAIKVLDPSQGLEAMYKWWFHCCARALRLSHFLFNERRADEEGQWVDDPLVLSDTDPVGIDGEPFAETSDGIEAGPEPGENIEGHVTSEKAKTSDRFESAQPTSKQRWYKDSYFTDSKNTPGRKFVRQGRFVRAPASDQVRIPRGQQTFLRVDEHDSRLNDRNEPVPEPYDDLHANSAHFQLVWLPPHFQIRIALFIFLLWTFAAVTGLGVTLGPLCFGRYVFKHYLPPTAHLNDVHAFCFGAYVVGGPVFLIIKHKAKLTKAYYSACTWIATNFVNHNFAHIARKVLSASFRALRVLYFYTTFGIVLPILLSSILEFYVYIPFQTSGAPETTRTTRFTIISLVQNWAVGVLYLKIIGRVIHSNQESRPARALFALVAPANNGAGWWDPDVKLATRAFFLPAIALVGAALTTPLMFGYLAKVLYFRAADTEVHTMVYRYSYPALAASILVGLVLRSLIKAYRSWRSRIRDEVYLVGERLHNFGERRPVVTNRIAASG